MIMIKKFEDFNNSIDIDSIIDSIPDSDIPSETNIIPEKKWFSLLENRLKGD